MKSTADILTIINPASAAGKTGRIIPAITRSLLRAFPNVTFLTERPGHAGELAAEAVRQGASMVVAVGGDGTINEVSCGMLSASGGRMPDTLLGIVNCGSGSGFAQSLGLPKYLDAQVRLLTERTTRSIDAGFLDASPGSGRTARRYFVNECQIGIGADVIRRNTGARKAAGGLVGYGAATISALFGTPNVQLRVLIDGTELSELLFLGLSIGNGARTGGGMTLTPGADLSDGLLDLLVIHGQSLASRLRSFPRIYRGTHVNSPCFSYLKARSIEVEGINGVTVAVDGELVGGLPCAIGIVPSALRVVCPPVKGAYQ